jgi:hypothetical protein
MKALVWSWRRNIDNPAMKTLPLRAGVGKVMKGRAFLGYQLYCHNSILALT